MSSLLKKGILFFPVAGCFSSASHAESSFVGASDVSHSICCNYGYYSGVPEQRSDTRCVTKDIYLLKCLGPIKAWAPNNKRS